MSPLVAREGLARQERTKRCNGLAGSVLSDGSSNGREPLIAIVRQ
jgi:hypothetical protein